MPSVAAVVDVPFFSRIPISTLINTQTQAKPQPPSLVRLYNRDFVQWRDKIYPFPWDESQRDFYDILHQFIYVAALGERLHTVRLRDANPSNATSSSRSSSISSNATFTSTSTPLHILDVGYGTGHWMIEMSHAYPTAKITGIDLVPFLVDGHADRITAHSPVDFTDGIWPVERGSQDLIHLAQLAGSVSDWGRLYRTVYGHLRPATGQIEHIEIDYTPRSHPAPWPANTPALSEWWARIRTASAAAHLPLAAPSDAETESLLEAAGFVDVSRTRIRIPFSGEENARSDPYERDMSDWFRAALCAGDVAGLSVFHLVRAGGAEREVLNLCRRVAGDVNRKGSPVYCHLVIYTARKPARSAQCAANAAGPESQSVGNGHGGNNARNHSAGEVSRI